MTAPAAGANVGGSTIALAATATDATSGVASVAFQVKPTGASSFTTVDADTNGAPFTGVWSPAPGVPDGPVDVRVAVTDSPATARRTRRSAPSRSTARTRPWR